LRCRKIETGNALQVVKDVLLKSEIAPHVRILGIDDHQRLWISHHGIQSFDILIQVVESESQDEMKNVSTGTDIYYFNC
jgi:hypothetical protein